jgi:hypothetical protein
VRPPIGVQDECGMRKPWGIALLTVGLTTFGGLVISGVRPSAHPDRSLTLVALAAGLVGAVGALLLISVDRRARAWRASIDEFHQQGQALFDRVSQGSTENDRCGCSRTR